MLDLEMPVPLEVTEHPPDGVLQDLTDRASWKMTEFVPHELGVVFVISPSTKTTCRCGLSRMSPDVRCTAVTAPLLTAPHAPRRAARSS
ncbi:hypothetical protein WMF23_21510 [Sorangium sp. So ce542]